MKNSVLLISLMLLLSTLALGQNRTKLENNVQTVRGCLMKAGTNYIISDHGTVYDILGNAGALNAYANDKVAIIGRVTSAPIKTSSETGSGSKAGQSSGSRKNILLTEVDKISDECGTSGGKESGSGH